MGVSVSYAPGRQVIPVRDDRLSLYLRPEEKAQVRRAAVRAGQTLSEYARQAIGERMVRDAAG